MSLSPVVRNISSGSQGGSSIDDHLLSVSSGSFSSICSLLQQVLTCLGGLLGEKYRCAPIDMFLDDVWIVIFAFCIINEVDYQPWGCNRIGACVDDGDNSYSHRHTVSTSNWSAHVLEK